MAPLNAPAAEADDPTKAMRNERSPTGYQKVVK